MKIQRTVLGALAITALGFAAGHWLAGWTSPAAAAPLQAEGQPPEMPPEVKARFEAWEKAGLTGEQHGYLEPLIGDWEGTFRMRMDPDMDPMECSGTIKREWVLDKHFVKEAVHWKTPGMGEFHGLGYIGYNNVDGQYEFVWLQSQSTAIMFGTAHYDPDQKALRFNSSYRDPATGKVVQSWSEIDLSSSGQHNYVGWQLTPEGRKFKSVEGDMHRKP